MAALTPNGFPGTGTSLSLWGITPFKSYILEGLGSNPAGLLEDTLVGASGLIAVTFSPPSIFQPFKALWLFASSAVISFSFQL